MRKIFSLVLFMLLAVGAYAQAPQYGRFYKTLTQSTSPTQPCQIGTMLFNTTSGHQFVCGLSNTWFDLTSWTNVTFPSRVAVSTTTDALAAVKITDGGGSSTGWFDTTVDGKRTYGLYVTLYRPTTGVFAGTAGVDDAGVRVAVRNYAATHSNYIMRGGNFAARNSNSATMGTLSGLLAGANNNAGTAPTVLGAEINAENYGTNATVHGGVDVTVKNEAAKAATEFGVRVRNLNNSIAGTSGAAFLVGEPSLVNTGWDYILDANSVKVGTADIRFSNGQTLAKYASDTFAGLKLTKTLTAGMPTAGNESIAFSVENNRSGVDDEAVNTVVTAVEGVTRARGPGRNLTIRGGHFRTYIDETYAGADAITSVGIDGSARASGAVTPHAGTAFVGVRAYMAPGFSSMTNVTNNHAFWAYNEHATNAITNVLFASDGGGGFTNGVNLNGATIPASGCQMKMSNGACIYVGAQTTRNAVRTAVGTDGSVGSIYLSSAGKIYLKVASAGADTDWEKVTTSAAD